MVYLQRWRGWCHKKLLPSGRVLCTPYNHALCHFMQSHIRKVYECLAVTCHLHFWQNDRSLLRATAVTRGWNGYRNKSQHRKLTLEKKILPPLLPGFEPATFRSRVRRSNHWAIPAPPCSYAGKIVNEKIVRTKGGRERWDGGGLVLLLKTARNKQTGSGAGGGGGGGIKLKSGANTRTHATTHTLAHTHTHTHTLSLSLSHTHTHTLKHTHTHTNKHTHTHTHVQTSAARLVFKACKHEHIKPLLQKLHWLPVVSRIQYKVASLCYNSFTESYPIFLNSWLSTVHPDNFASFLTPAPSAYLSQKQRPLDNELFLSRARHNGTRYRVMFVTQHQHLLSSKP